VITPYFGHSDGRTRNWTEVWGGTQKAWLQSVEATYDAGLSMFGHGVGMSCNDAAHRADEDAWTYEQLLRYYYLGTQAEKIY
jgi:peptidoglycan hydrolase-like amidase